MGLFSRKKDKQENSQTQEVKQATLSKNPEKKGDEQSQQPFVNPFSAQQSQNTSPPMGQQGPAPQFSMQQEAPTPDFAAGNLQESAQLLHSQSPQENSPLVQMDEAPVGMDMNISSFGTPNASMSEEQIQELIDETVEKVIEEKWEKVVSNVEKVLKWKDSMEGQLTSLKDDIVHMGEQFETFEKKILNKISSYDTNLTDVNSEMKALEKVFQKITPTLVNNVNELEKIAESLKGIKRDDKQENAHSSKEQKSS